MWIFLFLTSSQGLLQKYQGTLRSILKAIYALDNLLDAQVSSEMVRDFLQLTFKVLKESIATLFPEIAIAFKCRSVLQYL